MSLKSNKGKEDSVLSAKQKMLSEVLHKIESQYGKGSIMRLGDASSQIPKGDVVSTGSLLLDEATGCGGIAKGRIVEIYGPESSGKTTIALQLIAEVQKQGGNAVFIDAEHALDLSYASDLGVVASDLVVSQPDYGEQALDIAETVVRSGVVDIIVIDSVAALVPKAELEGDMGDTHVGLLARLMSQALRKLTALVNRSKVILVFINQVRQNIGGLSFGPKETTPGGNALKFAASLRFEVRRVESLKDKNGKQFGNRVNIKIVKNKLSRPFVIVSAHLIFGQGISRFYEAMTLGLEKGIVKQSGSWLYIHDEKICQGKEAFVDRLSKDSSLYNKLYEEISQGVVVKSLDRAL
jgi:recombination protein RecA